MTEFATSHAIKLFCKGEIRRFAFAGETVQQLRGEIQNLLQISEFVIKYEDDEGDFVTIGTDSELAYGFQLAGARPLRLKVVPKAKPESAADEKATALEATFGKALSSPTEKPWKEMKKEAKMVKIQFKQEKQLWKEELKAARLAKKEEMKQQKNMYVARFVKHVTAEDGQEFAPGTTFLKTWRFRNEGTVAWPEKSVLLCVGKKSDQIGAVSDSIVLEKSVFPGEEVDVSVPMTAPSAGGSYTGFWRLADPSGRKFGPRVRVQIKVVDSSSSSSDEGSSYGDMLTQLESMGFTNKALNVKMLVRTNGNLDKVVRKLLKRQQKMSGVIAKKP